VDTSVYPVEQHMLKNNQFCCCNATNPRNTSNQQISYKNYYIQKTHPTSFNATTDVAKMLIQTAAQKLCTHTYIATNYEVPAINKLMNSVPTLNTLVKIKQNN
jgi:hypothetical protein